MGVMDWIPKEVRPGRVRLVVQGQEEVLVEQHRGLISYETDRVMFRTGQGRVTVQGEGLIISAFGPWDARVEGKIGAVLMEEEQ